MRAAHETAKADGIRAPYKVNAANIQFSAFKKSYDADGYILRLFKNQGKATDAEIELPPCFAKAYRASMNDRTECELPIVNGKVVRSTILGIR